MLRQLVSRWLTPRAMPPQAPAPAPARPRAPGGAEARAAAPAAPAQPVGVGAQRPLVGADGGLAGFDFHVGPGLLERLRRGEDVPRAAAATANLLGAMRLCIGHGRIALAEVPAGWLAGPAATAGAIVPGMHLTLLPDATFADPAAFQALTTALRAQGARVGWPADASAPAGARPDHLRLTPPPERTLEAWQRIVAATAACWRGVPLVLPEAPDVDSLETLLAPPVVLAGVAVGQGAAAARAGRTVPPQAQPLLRLLHRLVRDDDNALLVADIKADAGLALRLLEHLNTAGAMPGRTLDSIDQAVLVLGRTALYRWVAQMLVRVAPARPAGGALQSLALARAKLLEAIAREAGEPQPGSFYLLGLASVLPELMQCPVDEAIASLQLPPPAVQALRDASGPWHRHLALVLALERHDLAAATPLAEACGGLDTVLAHAAKAWLPG